MASPVREYATVATVSLASLVLFGSFTFASVLAALSVLLRGVDVTPARSTWWLVAVPVGLLALQVTRLAARCWLHGFEQLNEGLRRRRLARYLTLLTPAVAAVIVAVDILLRVTRSALANDRTATLAVTAVVALALVAGVGRTVAAFVRGVRGAQ